MRANTGTTTVGAIMLLLSMHTNTASSAILALASLFQVWAEPIALAIYAKVPLSAVLADAAS